jgi:hypothetical protein
MRLKRVNPNSESGKHSLDARRGRICASGKERNQKPQRTLLQSPLFLEPVPV